MRLGRTPFVWLVNCPVRWPGARVTRVGCGRRLHTYKSGGPFFVSSGRACSEMGWAAGRSRGPAPLGVLLGWSISYLRSAAQQRELAGCWAVVPCRRGERNSAGGLKVKVKGTPRAKERPGTDPETYVGRGSPGPRGRVQSRSRSRNTPHPVRPAARPREQSSVSMPRGETTMASWQVSSTPSPHLGLIANPLTRARGARGAPETHPRAAGSGSSADPTWCGLRLEVV